jgi:hypothetical protein
MQVTAMASQIVNELRTTTGEWTTRQVLCHLLFEPGWRPGPVLFSFAPSDLPVIDIKPGQMYLTPERQMMPLPQFENVLDRHRREALAYLETLR